MSARVRAHIRNNVIGYLALFVALSGTAWAANGPLPGTNQVGSSDIINGEVLGADIGTDQVRSGDVRDDSLTGGGLGSSDIALNALTGADIDESQLDLSNTIGNAIVFFEGACPAGWSEFTTAQGRYLVGLPSGGTLSQTVGTALESGENRAVGQHDHGGSTAVAGSHNHPYAANWGWSDGPDETIPTTRRPLFDFKVADSVGVPSVDAIQPSGAHSHSIASAGSEAGTNAPYVQLRACKLDT